MLPTIFSDLPSIEGLLQIKVSGQSIQTNCTSRGYHNAAVNTTVILCNYQGDTVNNPGEMYDFVFTINFFGNSSSPNPSFISFYLQDAPPGGSMDSVEDVFLFSKPVILWPGQQLFGVPMMSSQRPQSDSGAALFSIPQYRKIYTWNIESLVPNPSPLAYNNSRASLRLMMSPIQPKMVFDYEAPASFLGGISFIGGVWTFVEGTFAATFGTTLFLVLFGIKPLSVYGLVHKFSKDRPVLATIEKAKPLTDAERDQIIQIMREHLLDCDDIPETRPGSSKENVPPISL